MKIVVVGLGVIGGSFTMALKKAGYNDVYGIDINEESLEKAKRQGFIKDGFTSGSEIVKDADLIIISLYPRLVKKFILDNKENFKDGAVITDATGIKKLFVEDVINILPSNIDFVFGHPMAGREKKGIDFASAEVFNGANYIITPVERNKPENPVEKLEIKNLTCINSDGIKTLNNVSLTANSGEILGIAGIAGSGQKELLEAITGLQDLEGGSIIYKSTEGMDIELLGIKASDIEKSGIKISFVPEDRLGMGLVASMGMTDNMMLRSYNKENRFFVDRKKPRELARSIIEKLSVVTPGTETPVGRLSGGNVQKVLVGREIANNPEILILAYPVRGLDINSSYTIYNLMNEQKKKGVAVICVIEDLDVLIELCDKIVVLNSGEVSGILDARKTNKEEVGLLMTRHRMEELKDA